MPIRKIVGFIAVCILMLALLSLIFPKQGIDIGSFSLNFPSIEDVLIVKEDNQNEIDPEKQLALMEEAFHLKNLEVLADSNDYYEDFFANSPVRIQFPDNNPALFDSLFSTIDRDASKQIVRILHYGDSQIEQDRISDVIRASFQERFGGRGMGMIPAIQVIPTSYINQRYSGNMQRYIVYGPADIRASHNRYGPMGQVCEVTDSGTITINARELGYKDELKYYSQIKMMVGHNSQNFKAVLYYNDKTDGEQQIEKAIADSSTLTVLTWNMPKSVNSFSITMSGSAEIYALLLDGNNGVAVDNIPMRGCSGTMFTGINADLLRMSYRKLNVQLLILEYGGNAMPAMNDSNDVSSYKESISRQIRFFKELIPEANILFIGPADMSCQVDGTMQTYPLLEATIEAIKEAALENGAAFWDMYQVMGGHNSMLQWVKKEPPLAGSDYIHFTRKGATEIAQLLDKSLSMCYNYYHFRKSNGIADSTLMEIDALDRNSRDYSREFDSLLRSSSSNFDSLTGSEKDYETIKKSLETMRNTQQNQQNEQDEK